MALNIKAALTLCIGFIGTVSWLLQRVGAPETVVISPLVPRITTDEGPSSAVAVADAAPRETVLDRLARPSPIVSETQRNRASERALAWMPPVEPDWPASSSVELPPLVFAEEPRVASAVDEEILIPGPVAATSHAHEATLVSAASLTETWQDTPPSPAFAKYVVRKGDTLTGIARRNWGSDDKRLVALLLDANPAVRGRRNRILVGEALRIPDEALAQRVLSGESRPQAAPGTGSAVLVAAHEAPNVTWYTIRSKDTLASIAERYLKDRRRWPEIAELNKTPDPHRIQPGTRIMIPSVEFARG